ncbi:hypothetical protein ACSCB1_11990 [Streptomyces europaeiscabiei]|uniref:hypothetical protein n=1 Tax=Streptomyces europaeiscabiei TaxID=146819 RepID=UPI001F266D64|nr:hypothetical protein [Streptomyces europaeiscabiei]
MRCADELRSEAEPVGERVRLVVEVGDLLACRLQRFPDAFQDAVLGMKEVIDRLRKAGTVLGGPDLVGQPRRTSAPAG